MIRRPSIDRLFEIEGAWYAFCRRWNTGDGDYANAASIDDATIRKELGLLIAELQKVESELKALETSEEWLG